MDRQPNLVTPILNQILVVLTEFLKANGRGLQYDNSFHHRTDGVNNTLSYGLNWAKAFVEWAYYVQRDSIMLFRQKRLKVLVDYYLDGVCKTSVFGVKPDYGCQKQKYL